LSSRHAGGSSHPTPRRLPWRSKRCRLKQTLGEEEATDKALTALGESGINQAAVATGGGEEEEE
jgi:hypothetical protein